MTNSETDDSPFPGPSHPEVPSETMESARDLDSNIPKYIMSTAFLRKGPVFFRSDPETPFAEEPRVWHWHPAREALPSRKGAGAEADPGPSSRKIP